VEAILDADVLGAIHILISSVRLPLSLASIWCIGPGCANSVQASIILAESIGVVAAALEVSNGMAIVVTALSLPVVFVLASLQAINAANAMAGKQILFI
jgi:hypothetical protein